MAWQPQDGPLRQLAGLLQASTNGRDKIVQKQAELVCAAGQQDTLTAGHADSRTR
jgi:hypothetical protein